MRAVGAFDATGGAKAGDGGAVERIIVGLGNPGAKYEQTRHNVGFMALDALAREVSGAWRSRSPRLEARTCRTVIAGHPTLLVEPLTYMNGSGDVLPPLLGECGLGAGDVVVLLDDLSLPLGRIRVRARGSAGGHHGLESVMDALGTDEVVRVRLGVGEDDMPKDKVVFVLAEFPPERRAELDDMVTKAGDAVKSILGEGVAKTMTIFNGSTSKAVKE